MIKLLLRSLGALACLAALALPQIPAFAALTDISGSPISSTNSAQVKPNIMLLMDTSGSMGWSHMPDEVEGNSGSGLSYVGYKSSQCNVLYYNPTLTYQLPKKPDGTLFPAPSFTSAPYAGYSAYYVAPDATDLSNVNLSTSFQAYDSKTTRNGGVPDTAQGAYYYVYSGTQSLTYNAAPCTDTDTGVPSKAATGGGTWTRVSVNALPVTSQANFAIWYSYYRIRISLIKSAASLAFTPLTDTFRVGFITVQPKDSPTDTRINQAKYLKIDDFNSGQRSAWYNKLFSQVPGGASPTREGLARVGRMYAGKHDSINGGMDDDPVQYSCQQNFTILTTDGYWNAQTESSPYGGALGIDGKTLVGQTDGTLNASTKNPDTILAYVTSPRPIWDGTTDGTGVIENYTNSYAYAQCGSFASRSTTQTLQSTQQVTASTSQATQMTSQVLQSTVQNLASTVRNLQSTTQNQVSTLQNLQSTSRILASTNQNLQSTLQTTRSTSQTLRSTVQKLRSTNQNLKSTSQTNTTKSQITQTVAIVRQSTTQNLQSTAQNLQNTSQTIESTAQTSTSTSQILKSSNQTLQSTTQTLQTTAQTLQSTNQNLSSTNQKLQSTSQTTQSTSQVNTSTLQLIRSTSQTTITTSQVQQTTSQTRACDARTELCTYTGSATCTPTTYIRCETTITGPALVASCTPQSAVAANNFTDVTCVSSGTGPTGTASCVPAAAGPGNSYTTTSCNTVTTGPTAVASCAPTTPSAGNAYTATSCSSAASGPTPSASCAPVAATAANNYTTTTCSTATSGPVGVAACTPAAASSSNGYTTTSCNTVTTTNVPVANCTAAGAGPGNGYTSTTCPAPIVTTNVPTATCTPAVAASSNNYTTTTCSSNSTSGVAVPSCLASTANSGNGYTTTTCASNNTTNVPVASCTAAGATAANGYTTTTCIANNLTNTPVASCTPSGPTSANGYTTTTCPPPATTTDVPAASCSPATASSSNSYTTTTCRTATTGPTAGATCTPATAGSGNGYTATTCTTSTTGPIGVATCTAVPASSANSFTATSCGSVVNNNVPVASCTPSTASSTNAYVTTTCGTNNTNSVPVATCAASGPTAANGYTTTTCPTPVTTSNVAVASCSASGPTAANNYTTTTCATTPVSGPTVVSSCTPSAPTATNGYQSTTCGTIVSTTPSASCVASGPTLGNNYTTTTCPPPVTTTNVPVASCVNAGANNGNNYTATTCSTNTQNNVPVASCTASGPTSGNGYTTTTCPTPITTTNVPVSSCTAAGANVGNSYTTTTCPIATTGPTGVSSCSGILPSASNNYTTTTCGTNNTTNVAVATCTASGPGGGNGYTTTTCPPANVTTDVPSASCAPASASSANSYTTTTCRTDTTTNVPVQSCVPATASSGNGYLATSCTQAATGPGPTSTCTPVAASAANNWTTTSCPAPIVTTNVPVATCTPAPALSGNNYTTTTCPTPLVGHDVPQAAACTPSAASSSNGYVTTTCPTRPVTTTDVPVASCSPAVASSSNSYTTTTCRTATTGPVGVASCTPIAASSANNYSATTCPGTVTTGPTGVASCTPAAASAANSYVATTCGNNNTSSVAVPAAACPVPYTAPDSGNGFLTTTCSTVTTGPTILAASACTAAGANAGNSFTGTTCTQTFGSKVQYTQTHSVSKQLYSGGVAVGAPTVTTDAPVGPTDLNGTCFAPGTAPSPLVKPTPEPLPALPTACSAWPCTTTLTNPSGSTNSLADVAQYYYINDLRPAADWPATATRDISTDNVKAVGNGPEDDRVTWQHMTTFTLGLGVSGTLNYRSDYPSATTGDFASIRTGVSTKNLDGTSTATAWPLWPDPAVDYTNFDNWSNPKSIDDFWHTAVNGRGRYFSAGDPTSVVSGLSGALIGVQARLSGGSAAGVTTLQPTATSDNRTFVSSYTTSDWTGELQAFGLDTGTGGSDTTLSWSAQALLDARTSAQCDDRTIYLMHGGNMLVNFSWNGNVTTCTGSVTNSPGLDTTEQANFTLANAQLLSQWSNMSVAQQAVTPGVNLVNFLRGQRGYEGFVSGVATKLYRTRKHVLGDIVDAQPVFVGAPSFSYADAGYAQYKIDQANRTPMVYVAANDGMLHAFMAGTNSSDPQGGKEAWAVVPSAVLPTLFRLADDNYRNIHQFSVDGTPVVADTHDSSGWKTLLVGGLNDGGKAFYALDVTDPATPKALWEFKAGSVCHGDSDTGYTSDCYLGYSFGKPVVTKLNDANGTWVVLFTSGYNNIGGGSQDGQGFLYVVNATTGAVMYRISTQIGSAATPSGLAQINTYLDYGSVDNTVVYAYGGDTLGNVWRFNLSTTHDASLVGVAKDKTGAPQPITVRPELAELNGKPMVLVATGRLLGASDIGDLQVQSIYGIVDQLMADKSCGGTSASTTCAVYPGLRGALKPLSLTVSVATSVAGVVSYSPRNIIDCTPATATACKSTNGWVIDFPMQTNTSGVTANVGERVNVNMSLALGTLVVGSNVPQSSACTTGGYSWLNQIDLATGLAVQDTANNLEVSTVLSVDSLLVGLNVVMRPQLNSNGTNKYSADLHFDDASGHPQDIRVVNPVPLGKRISWREIVQ